MLDLLKEFSIEQIIIYSVLLCAVIKTVTEFFIWCKDKYHIKFDKDFKKVSREKISDQQYRTLTEKVDTFIEQMTAQVNRIENQVAQLIVSDMHDIKSFIVEKHHVLIKQGWVDDFTMDTLEKRYEDYLKECGNSYVEGLMADIRKLPHFPPETK